MSFESCPNCGSEIKDGFFSGNLLVERNLRYINAVLGEENVALCQKCEPAKNAEAARVGSALMTQLETASSSIPILSLHCPLGWDYDAIGIATAQSVIGTGIVSEIGSSLTDLFGMKSGIFQGKIREGENACKSLVRMDVLRLGGNALIGVDIDYGELGGLKGMVMVCMTGTAIRLNNPEIMGPDVASNVARAASIHRKLERAGPSSYGLV